MNRHLTCLLVVFAIAANLQLVESAAAALTHRYSFDGNTDDSAGSIDGALNGGAAVNGGQLVLDGVDSYLSLPSSPLPSGDGQSATFEVWGTYATDTPEGSRIFDFSDGAQNYLFLTPNSTVNTPTTTPSTGPETRFRYDDGVGEFGIRSEPGSNTGSQVLLTAVVDFPNNLLSLYRNGALVTTTPMLTNENVDFFRDLAGANSFRLGHGQSAPSDAMPDLPGFLSGSINEFRIYDQPLSSLDILNNAISGPDVATVSFTDKTWNAGSSDWNTGGNWTAAGVPDSTNRAVIANGGTATVSAASSAVGTVRITNGALTIASGGSLESVYPIEMSPTAGNTATINVNSSNTLTLSGILPNTGGGDNVINIDGGRIRSGFATAFVDAGATTNIGAGGATFDVPSGQMSWSSELAGSGDIHKTGDGTLVLNPAAGGLAFVDQNPNFTGEFFVDEGTLDVRTSMGVFGSGGSTLGGSVHVNNAKLIVQSGTGDAHDWVADLNITGEDNLIENLANATGTEIKFRSSLSGDGTIRIVKTVLPDALGIDFENRPANTVNGFQPIDNANFTGRFIADGNWAIRFRGAIEDPDTVPESGDEIDRFDVDLPNAILELPTAFAWVGKRGPDPNQVVRLGGVAGGTSAEIDGMPGVLQFTRLQARIAGGGDPNASLTYQIGGANEDVEFGGIVQNGDGDAAWGTEIVSLTKVGDNAQTFSGPLTYSGPTTVEAGTLLINGRHSMDAREMASGAVTPVDALPVSDYTVNSGGTLGGSGFIGSPADPVDVNVAGGTIAPGASVGTLTVEGNVTLGMDAAMSVELDGATSDLLAVIGNLDLSALGNSLLVSGSGTGDTWTIATYTGSLSGEFESITSGYEAVYGGGMIQLNKVGGGCIEGDFSCNGAVENADLTLLLNNWAQAVPPTPAGWVGTAPTAPAVDNDELTALLNNWGNVAGSGSVSSSAVPEPSSIGLVVLAAAIFAGIRRRL